MDYKTDLIQKIEKVCLKEKGLYKWLDETIDEIINNAKELIRFFPSDDILNIDHVFFFCEEMNSDFVIDLYILYGDAVCNGLEFGLNEFCVGISNNDGAELGLWYLDSGKSLEQIAVEVYSELKKILTAGAK